MGTGKSGRKEWETDEQVPLSPASTPTRLLLNGPDWLGTSAAGLGRPGLSDVLN